MMKRIWTAQGAPHPASRDRQRHDIPWSQPLPLEPRTLADDPLPVPASECSAESPPPEPLTAEPAQPEAEPQRGTVVVPHPPRKVLAAHAAEVERLKREHEEEWRIARKPLYDRAVSAEAEVERLRGELAQMENLNSSNAEVASRTIDRVLGENRELRTELAKARAERPMPEDEELARALRQARNEYDQRAPEIDVPYWEHLARAAKAALLGVRREGVTREENPDGGRPAETTDALAGMPTPWRERLELLEAKASRIDKALHDTERDLDRRVDAGSKRLDALERDRDSHEERIISLCRSRGSDEARIESLERAVEGLKGEH